MVEMPCLTHIEEYNCPLGAKEKIYQAISLIFYVIIEICFKQTWVMRLKMWYTHLFWKTNPSIKFESGTIVFIMSITTLLFVVLSKIIAKAFSKYYILEVFTK